MPRKHSKCLACREYTAPKGSNICTECWDYHFNPEGFAPPPVEPRHSQAVTRPGVRIIETEPPSSRRNAHTANPVRRQIRRPKPKFPKPNFPKPNFDIPF